MNQNKLILDYMLKHPEGITPEDARQCSGSIRLSARIWDLRHKYGIAIKGEPETAKRKNRFGIKPTYQRYWLEEPKQKAIKLALKHMEKKTKAS